jgi:peroxiredoxin
MLNVNDTAPTSDLLTHANLNSGRSASDDEKLLLIKFHRFAGCPVAQRQIDELLDEQTALDEAGIDTVVVLHNSVDKLNPELDLPAGVSIVADREKELYRSYDSKFSMRKMFAPRSVKATMRSFRRGYFPIFSRFQGGVSGVPSDFLVGADGKIHAAHYGRNYGDSWSVAQVLEAAKVDELNGSAR